MPVSAPLLPHHLAIRYGRDLLEELDNVLDGKFQRVIMSAIRDPVERDAHILMKAMKGVGYDEETLLEVLISREGAPPIFR
jgi:hypothetical protein